MNLNDLLNAARYDGHQGAYQLVLKTEDGDQRIKEAKLSVDLIILTLFEPVGKREDYVPRSSVRDLILRSDSPEQALEELEDL